MKGTLKLLRRWLRQIFAISLIVVGLIIFPLPIPIGALMMTIGLALLISANRPVARWIKERRARLPKLNNKLGWMEKKLPRFISRAIRRTAPDYGNKQTDKQES